MQAKHVPQLELETNQETFTGELVTFLYFPTKPGLAVFQGGLKMVMIDCFFRSHFIREILDYFIKPRPCLLG